MIIGIMISLYMINSHLITSVGKTKVTNTYIEKIAKVNNRWNEDVALEKTEDELKKEILAALDIVEEKNVQIFFLPFDEQSSTQGNQLFLPRTGTANFIEHLPLTIDFPLLATAMVGFEGQRWLTTRMIAHDGVVLTMVNSTVIDH